MSVDIDFCKYNYNKIINNLMNDKGINDRKLLDKILDEFGEHIGEYYIMCHNEYYQGGICDWNLWTMLDEVFEIKDSSDCFYDNADSEEIISYKEIDEAYENLGLERKEEDEEE